jgi:hypothetical protein
MVGSYGSACALLVLLMVLVYVGTWEQKDIGLYEVQRRYFESLVVVHWIGGVFPLVLPAAYPLLVLLFVNLVVGGIVRIRKNKSTVGILIAHVGILVLLLGGFVESTFATKGSLALEEGQASDQYQSYYEWDVVVVEPTSDGRVREHVVPYERFEGLDPGETSRFTSASLPFDVAVSNFARNAEPRPAAGLGVGAGVDGFVLQAHEADKEAERNVPGVVVTLTEKAGGAKHRAILYGRQRFPYQAFVAGKRFDVDLRRRRFTLPFAVRLNDFVRVLHPGTTRPKEYSSYVTAIEGGSARDVHITMNAPLRDRGYTLYQSSFFPQGPDEPDPNGSVFSVVANPSDRVPIVACVIIALGLAIHFWRKLRLHILAERSRA